MSFLKKIFGKDNSQQLHKGFFALSVSKVNKLSNDAVEIVFDLPSHLIHQFDFKPGQHLTFIVQINGIEYRRSYSLCNGQDEPLTIAVKRVDGGKVSNYLVNSLRSGDVLQTSLPEGHFSLQSTSNVVAIAAGSGITPILSMAKEVATKNGSMHLFYANKTIASAMYLDTIKQLSGIDSHLFLTQEKEEGYLEGRITKQSFIDQIKENLELLKADGFYICGPEEMIFGVRDALTMFGVPEDKIHFELFTTPTQQEEQIIESTFDGKSQVKVIIDDEEYDFELGTNEMSILDRADKEGADVPYSCKGGVCSTCKAKVLDGSAKMSINYSLTDSEVEEGYILTCQAHPTSEKLTVSYDD